MLGADTTALRWFATLARRTRDDVGSMRDQVGAAIERLPWRGADRDLFLDEWRRAHAPSLTALVDELSAVAAEAERQAQRQDEAARRRD